MKFVSTLIYLRLIILYKNKISGGFYFSPSLPPKSDNSNFLFLCIELNKH